MNYWVNVLNNPDVKFAVKIQRGYEALNKMIKDYPKIKSKLKNHR